MPYNGDLSGPHQEGIGIYQTTNRNARRCSAAVGYLGPARGRPNLEILTDSVVTRIVVENGRAIGVERVEGNRTSLIRADARGHRHRRRHRLAEAAHAVRHRSRRPSRRGRHQVVHDLAGVGENLQDHMAVDVVCGAERSALLRQVQEAPAGSSGRASNTSSSAAARSPRTSPKAAPSGGATGARRRPTSSSISCPAPASRRASARSPAATAARSTPIRSVRARAASVRLRSADPGDQPIIDPNSFAEPYDLDRAVDGVKISREIMAQPAFALSRPARAPPRPKVRSKADYEDFARAVGALGLSPGRHLQDGLGRRCGGRSGAQGQGARRPSRLRQLGHAEPRLVQHQCRDDHDRREGGRPHSGQLHRVRQCNSRGDAGRETTGLSRTFFGSPAPALVR